MQYLGKLKEYRFLILTEIILIIILFPILKFKPLAGLDTPGHLHALEFTANSLLNNFSLTGYDFKFFAGYPLFVSYAPFMFYLLAAIYYVILKWLPLFFILKLFTIFLILIFPILFYSLVKSFFNVKKAKYSVIFSLFFLLYPKIYSFSGMGASSALWGGLIPAFFGLDLLLIFIILLNKVNSSKRFLLVILGALCLCVLIISHVLSAIGGLYYVLIISASNWKNKPVLTKYGAVAMGGILLALFWILPFLQNLPYTSGSPAGLGAEIADPFLALYPINLGVWKSIQEGLLLFNWGSIFLLITSGIGFYFLIKNKQWTLVGAFSMMFLFITRNILPTVFSTAIHYQRFLPFLYILMLVIATYGFEHLVVTRKKAQKYIFVLFLVLSLSTLLISYTLPQTGTLTDQRITTLPCDWESYPLYSESMELVEKLQDSEVESLFVQIPPDVALLDIGSTHRMDHLIAEKTSIRPLFGLYAESATLTPFIMPLTEAFSGGKSQAWGNLSLRDVPYFYVQDAEYYMNRFAYLGVSHLLIYSDFLKSTLFTQGYLGERLSEHFTLVPVEDYGNMIEEPSKSIGAFLQAGGEASFEDISLALFVGPTSYNIPVVEFKGSAEALKESNLIENLSFLIISSPNNESCLEISTILPLPIYCATIKSFEPITKDPLFDKLIPPTWPSLYDFVERYSEKKGEIAQESLTEITGNQLPEIILKEKHIEIKGHGIVLLNIGYTPLWRLENCEKCELYRVSPSHFLVLVPEESNQPTILYYNDPLLGTSLYLSLTGIVWLIISYYFLKKKNYVSGL